MSSTSGTRYVTGQAQATDTADLTIATIGFLPKKFRIFNVTNQIQIEWNAGLPD